MKKFKYFVQSILAGIGTTWMFLEAYKCLETSKISVHFWMLILAGSIIGLIWFFVDGFLFEGFLKKKIVIKSNAIDVQIEIFFGDIFKQKGWKAIGVNEYFDSSVDDSHVSAKSLHGTMLNKYWNNNFANWDNQIETDLKSIVPLEINQNRPTPAKKKKYKIGTTAKTLIKKQKFLCTVVATTNVGTLQASSNSEILQTALKGMLSMARQSCSGETLNIPLIGSGLSKTGIKHNIIIDLLLLSIFEESKKEKITQKINIVLPQYMTNKLNLMNIWEDWR